MKQSNRSKIWKYGIIAIAVVAAVAIIAIVASPSNSPQAATTSTSNTAASVGALDQNHTATSVSDTVTSDSVDPISSNMAAIEYESSKNVDSTIPEYAAEDVSFSFEASSEASAGIVYEGEKYYEEP